MRRAGWSVLLLVWLLCVPRWASAAEPSLRVLAASSLSDVMTELGRRFAQRTGRAAPSLAFSGSSELVRQVGLGDPAHLVVTSDQAWADVLSERGALAGAPSVIASNRLVLVVPVASSVSELSALATASVRSVAVAAEQVPAGRRAREALAAAGLEVAPKFVIGRNVRAALALADRDEVDAAVVYRSDALASDRVRVVHTFAAETHAPIVYPAARTTAADASDDAAAFLAFLRSDEAQQVFAEAGFGPAVAEVSAAPAWRGDPGFDDAPLWRTLWVAALSLALSVVPAVFLGWLLARRSFVGKTALSTILMTPLVLPPVVVGFVLLELLGRNGPFAGLFEALGVQVAFTSWGAVIAASVVGFPLLTLMSRLAIEAVDARYEQVARTLGLSPLRAFLRVGLPLSAPGLLAGCVLAYARALGEFGATAVLATDVPGETRTLALAIYALYEQPGLETAAHRLMWISIALCAVALLAYERLSKWQKSRLSGT